MAWRSLGLTLILGLEHFALATMRLNRAVTAHVPPLLEGTCRKPFTARAVFDHVS